MCRVQRAYTVIYICDIILVNLTLVASGIAFLLFNMSQSSCISKCPPKLNNDCNYETWKEDVKIWCEFTDLDEKKRALAIHLTLTGRARIASSEVGVEELKKETGVETLIAKLDTLFLPEKERRQFSAFNNLYSLRRTDCLVKNFIAEFEHQYFKFQQEGMNLPDPVIAFMLLSSCNLSETEVHLVMSALNKVTYEGMKGIIMRIFGSDMKTMNLSNNNNSTVEIKNEPTFASVENNEESALYGRGSWRGNNARGRARIATRWRGRGNRGVSTAPDYNNANRRSNPVGNDGQVSRCLVCDSKFHWARECPHSYESTYKKVEDSESVHLSLFVGYTKGAQECSKLETLLTETKNAALLDTGCTTTVCGNKWLETYTESLSNLQQSKIKVNNSESTFTFGDGRTFKSMKRVTIPCSIGGISVEITTDVVDCTIPLLLSAKSLKKSKLVWNFGDNTIVIAGKQVTVEETKSGHYILPLSM